MLELLNLDDPKHWQFAYTVAVTCRPDYRDDGFKEPAALVAASHQAIHAGNQLACIAFNDKEPVGIIYLDVAGCGVGCLHFAFLPSYRHPYRIKRLIKEFLKGAFDHHGFRKIKFEIETHSHLPIWVAEKLRFRKEGELIAERLKDGEPIDMIIYALFREMLQ